MESFGSFFFFYIYKGVYICDFLFAFLSTKILLNRGPLLEKNLLFLGADSFFKE